MQNNNHGPSPAISVIIPMYNAALYIKEAIDSVLGQTTPVSQVIVVDDGSTDSSAEIVSRLAGVVLIKKAHSGIGFTLLEGLAVANSGFIAFLDADDRWTPIKTQIQLSLLLNDPDVDMVFGHTERFQMMKDGDNIVEKKMDILPGVSLQGGFFRRSVFEKIGVFSTDPEKHHFMDWFAKAKDAGLKILIHPEVVFERRIHGENEGIVRKDDQRKRYFNTLRATIDARRAKG